MPAKTFDLKRGHFSKSHLWLASLNVVQEERTILAEVLTGGKWQIVCIGNLGGLTSSIWEGIHVVPWVYWLEMKSMVVAPWVLYLWGRGRNCSLSLILVAKLQGRKRKMFLIAFWGTWRDKEETETERLYGDLVRVWHEFFGMFCATAEVIAVVVVVSSSSCLVLVRTSMEWTLKSVCMCSNQEGWSPPPLTHWKSLPHFSAG